MNSAVQMIGDYENVSDYDATYLPMVTTVVTELMRQNIGVRDHRYRVEIPSAEDADYTSTDGIPVAMPTALTAQDQIKAVFFEADASYYSYVCETVDSTFYVIVPEDASGYLVVVYADAEPIFTALTDTLPIDDAAAVGVAVWGLASLLALDNGSANIVNFCESKYAEAKATWRKRNTYSPRAVHDAYSTNGYEGSESVWPT